jgi:hypothetical protein
LVRPKHGAGYNSQKKRNKNHQERIDAAGPGLQPYAYFECIMQVLYVGTVEQKFAKTEEGEQRDVENKKSLN